MAGESDIFQRLFEPLTDHGPGSESSTQRALMAIPDLPDEPEILDPDAYSYVFYIAIARKPNG